MTGLRRLCVLVLCLTIPACASLPRGAPAPDPAAYASAQIDGYSDIRFWGDEVPAFLNRILEDQRRAIAINPLLTERLDVLALSGGADEGAYGAGFLKGWTERGDRPEFTWVTGVSTGALIAPFAFLGPEYDDAIRRFYTETSAEDLFILTPFKALFGGASVTDTAPLRRIIGEEVDDAMVAAIAREYARGRLLMIGTTNLDAQRQVVWDIGRIASSGREDARDLIADVLLASASIPGAFPPVPFDVMIDGERFQELHVDGGVTHGIFVYPPALDMRAIEARIGTPDHKTFWLIRNAKLGPDYEPVDTSVPRLAARAILTLLKYQGRGDLIALERLARRDGFDFRLTHVPHDFNAPSDGFFDPSFMASLYNAGYRAAKSERPWQDRLTGIFDTADASGPLTGDTQ